MGSSIITELTSRQMEKKLGLEPRVIKYKKSDGAEDEAKVVIKFKPTDTEVIHVANTVAQMCGANWLHTTINLKISSASRTVM